MEKKLSFLEKAKEFWNTDVLKTRTGQLFLVFIGVTIFFNVLVPKFFAEKTYLSLLLTMSELGILSIAVFLCIVVGGINISVMANANLVCFGMGYFILTHVTPATTPAQINLVILESFGVGIIIGVIGGLLNGLIIGYGNLPALLATLGTGTLFTGIQKGLTGGESLTGYPEQLAYIGNGKIIGLPIPFLIYLAVAIVIFVMIKFTRFGYKLFMTGANEATARFSGIPTKRVTMFTYVIAGILSGLAGIVILGRTMSANPDYGLGTYVLFTIFVAVISGSGSGIGSIINVFIAMFALQTLQIGFNFMLQTIKGSTYFRDFIWGWLLIIFLIVNYFANVRKIEDN